MEEHISCQFLAQLLSGLSSSYYSFLKVSLFGSGHLEEAKTGPLDQRPCRESLKEERRPSWTLVLPAETDSMNVPSQQPMEDR